MQDYSALDPAENNATLSLCSELDPYNNVLIQPTSSSRINPNVTVGEHLGLAFGFLIATLGMITQGLLSFLLFEAFIRSLNLDHKKQEWLIWPLGIAIGLLSIINKITVFSSYMFNDFKEKGKNIQKFIRNPRHYMNNRNETPWLDQVKVLLDLPWTLIISVVLGFGITHLAFKSFEAMLVNNYTDSKLLTFAHVVGNPFFMTPFIASSVYCFYLVFPWVHANGANTVRDFLNYILENPHYRQLKVEQIRTIEIVAKEWKTILQSQNPGRVKQFLSAFFGYNTIDDAIIIKDLKNSKPNIYSILKFAKPNMQSVPPQTWKEFAACHGMALLATSLTTIGLNSFHQIGINTAQLLHVPTIYLQRRMGTSAFTSMSLLSLGVVYESVRNLMAYMFFERNYHYRALSRATLFFLSTILFTATCLAGFSNGYQEYTIDGTNLTVLNAILSYAMLDIFSVFSKIEAGLENHVVRNDPLAQLGKIVGDMLKDEITKVYTLDDKTLKQRATFFKDPTNAPVDPFTREFTRISPDIQNISPDRNSWKAVKRVSGKMGNAGISSASTLLSCFGLWSAPACLTGVSCTAEDAIELVLDTASSTGASTQGSAFSSGLQTLVPHLTHFCTII